MSYSKWHHLLNIKVDIIRVINVNLNHFYTINRSICAGNPFNFIDSDSEISIVKSRKRYFHLLRRHVIQCSDISQSSEFLFAQV